MKRITKTIAVCMMIPALMLGGLPVIQTASLAKSGKKAGAPVKLKKKSGTLTVLQDADRFTCGTTRIRVKKARGVKIKKISYKVENDHIARVSTKGKVTALTGGNTKILVNVKFKKKGKIKTKKLTYRLKVKKEFKNILSGLTVKYRNYATYVGGGEGIMPLYKTTTEMPEGFYVWECLDMTFEDPTIAEQGKAGFVLGKKAGSTKVTIKAKDGSGLSVTVSLKVVASEGDLRRGDDLMNAGTTEYLTAIRAGWTEEEQHYYMDNEGNLAYSTDWEKIRIQETDMKALIDEYKKIGKQPDNTPQDAVSSLYSTAMSMAENDSEDKAFLSALQEKIVKPVLSAQSFDQLVDCSINFNKQGLDGFISLSGTYYALDNYDEVAEYLYDGAELPDEPVPIIQKYEANIGFPKEMIWPELNEKEKTEPMKKFFRSCFAALGAGELSDQAIDDYMELMKDIAKTYHDAYEVENLNTIRDTKFMMINYTYPKLKIKQHTKSKGYKLVYNDYVASTHEECLAPLYLSMDESNLDALKLFLIQSATGSLMSYTHVYWNSWCDSFPDTVSENGSAEDQLKHSFDDLYKLIPYDMDQLYTKKYFPADAKKKFRKTVDEYITAYKSLIKNSGYGEVTRNNMLKKLDAMKILCLFPDDDEYKEMQIPYDLRTAAEGANLVENLLKIYQYYADSEVKTINPDYHFNEWWFPEAHLFDSGMPGENSISYYYYDNAVLFPYGNVGKDFLYHFSDTDNPTVDAQNIGRTADTIGLEIAYAFSPEGFFFNEKGEIQNFWGSSDDKERLINKLNKVDDVYNGLPMFLDMNKKTAYYKEPHLVTDVASANLSGMEAALSIIKSKYPGNDDRIRALYNDQVYLWLSYNVWKPSSKAEILAYTKTDFPFGRQRVNGTASMMDEFYRVFDVKETDAMYIAPEDRVKMWD